MSTVASPLGGKPSHIVAQIDNLSYQAAASLHDAASSIRERGHNGAKAIEDIAQSTGSRLDGVGSFIEGHDLKHAIRGSRQLVRRYPVESLVLAAGIGVLTGFAIRQMIHLCVRTEAAASR